MVYHSTMSQMPTLQLLGEIAPEQVASVHGRLLAWYRAGHRDLPWRQTREPYHILVSEVMLQQTQAERVVPKYHEFLNRFPTVQSLAAATPAEVIRAWAGLGYNRRAINLLRAARVIVDRYGGQVPRDRAALEQLPGVGRYTAGALLCFAFSDDVGFWDTNIARVLQRVFLGPELRAHRLRPRQLDALVERLVPPGEGYEWNQALIELGAVHCTARRPACLGCPLQSCCRAWPEIRTLHGALPRGIRSKREGRFVGSTRYYRGRLVEHLRRVPDGEGLDLLALGERLRPNFSSSHLPWLRQLVDELVRDGLVLAEERAEYDTADPRRVWVRLP
jgi:A/G-specific adenine glycosylase